MGEQTIMPILFVCEGESDEAFLDELIKKRSLSGFGVWHIDKGEVPPDQPGVSGFGKRLRGILTKTGIEACRLIIVIADNDDDPERTFKGIIKEIKKAGNYGLPDQRRTIVKPRSVPPSRHVPDLMVLMLPWDQSPGALETLCYRAGAAKRPALARCINAFVRCARINNLPVSKLSKIQVRCMLATLSPKNPDISFKWSWKRGKRGPTVPPWPVTHKEFSYIADYLRELSKQIVGDGRKRAMEAKGEL